MQLKNDIHVISGTHWDREWQFHFEKTRMLLAREMDELLDVLESNPLFVGFHMDGQTVPIVDYLEARPENRERIRKQVSDGRLLIGPWLVLPEENQMSGESLARNLLWGERHGREFGGCMKVGYSPTSWGQVSQMPQIFREAGVDSIIFYRGLDIEQIPGHYYTWQGPDGSRLLGLRLGHMARYGFNFCLIRPAILDIHPEDRTYKWSRGGKPLRVCGGGSASLYAFCLAPLKWNPDWVERGMKYLIEKDLGEWETTCAPAFACDDSIGPISDTTRIIEEAQKLIENDRKIIHDTLPGFIDCARREIDESKLPVLTGEMRQPARTVAKGLYAEIQAARMPTKYANRRAETALQRVAEPLSAIAWALGAEYPSFQLDRANFLLLVSHAHDSIGGCGHDDVDADVRYRLRMVKSMADMLTENAIQQIGGRIDTSAISRDEMVLIVFNPLPRSVSSVVKAEVDFERDRDVKGVRVKSLDGVDAPVQLIERMDTVASILHTKDTPAGMNCRRWAFYFNADDVPALGYKVYRVEPHQTEVRQNDSMLADFKTHHQTPMRRGGSMFVGQHTIENEHLVVSVNGDGTIDVTSKELGWTLRGLNAFEDRAEVGDYWMAGDIDCDRVISSRGGAATIAIIEDGPLCAKIEAKIRMELPIRARCDRNGRDTLTRPIEIRTVYRLMRGERFVRVETIIENTVEDHILRALFPSGVESDVICAETPFDVVERLIIKPDDSSWREPYRAGQPHQRFLDISDGKRGFALMNRGLPHYAAEDDPARTIALTLLRCHTAWNSIRIFFYEDQNATQLLGTHRFEYAIMPHAGDWRVVDLPHQADKFDIDQIVAAGGPGEGELPAVKSFVSVEGEGVALNAVKRGEWDDSLIIRISNLTDSPVNAILKIALPFESAETVNILENQIKGRLEVNGSEIVVPLAAKKIGTVRVNLKAKE